MSEVALQIIATIGDELQMARDEVQKLKQELEDTKAALKKSEDSSRYWLDQYINVDNMLKEKKGAEDEQPISY